MQTFVCLALFTFAVASGTNPTVPSSEFDCSAEPDVDYFYADPAGDCSVFYRCVSSNSLAYKYQCDPGLVFYEQNQRCEYPTDIPPPCGTQTTSGPGVSTYDCTGKPVGFYTTEACTDVYYNCDGTVTTATEQVCNSPLVVNTDTDTCDWTYNVAACNAGGTTTTVVTNVVTCAVDCSGKPEGYYTDPANPCSASFYYCDGSSSACHPQTCASGLVYNEPAGYCDWSYNVAAC